jgi:hypothetical protein
MEEMKQYRIIGIFMTIIGCLWIVFEYIYVNKLSGFGVGRGFVDGLWSGSRRVEYVLRILPLVGSVLSARMVTPNKDKAKRDSQRESQVYYRWTSLFLGGMVLVGWLQFGVYNLVMFPLLVSIYFWIVGKGWTNLGKKRDLDQHFKKIPKAEEQTQLMLTLNTDKGEMEIPYPNTGILTYGSQGSGKSASFAEPLIFQTVAKGWSTFIYDYKGRAEAPLTTATYQSYLQLKKRKEEGRYSGVVPKFVNLNFADPRYLSHFCNPIAPRYLQSFAACKNLMDAMYKNLSPQFITKTDFWYDNAITIAANVLWFLRNEFPEFCTIPHFTTLMLQPIDKILELLSLDEVIKMNMEPIMGAWENEAGGQLAGAQSSAQLPVSALNTKEVFWVFSGDEVDFRLNDPVSPTVLCIANNESMPQSYTPLIGVVFEVCKILINDNDTFHPLYICLDELPTAYFKDLDVLPATMRSKNVVLHILFQEEKQLLDLYGKEKGGKLMNMGNQTYGKLNDPISAERVSKVFGKKKEVELNNSFNDSGGGQSESTQKTEKITASDFLDFEVGVAAGRVFGAKPTAFKCKMEDARIHKLIGVKKEKLEELPKFGLEKLPVLDSEESQLRLLDELMEANFKKIHQDIKWVLEHYVPKQTKDV